MFKAIGLSVLVLALMGSVCFAEAPGAAGTNQEQTSETPKTTHTHLKKNKKHKKPLHAGTTKKEKKSTNQ